TKRRPKNRWQATRRSNSTTRTARSISSGRDQSLEGWRIICAAHLATYGAGLHRVILILDSAGGQVEEGDRVIHVLDELKQTRRLVTVVQDDKLCASMCIPIFLQGNDRLAGRASGWIFHEVTGPGADKKELKQQTLQLLDRYYAPAGVSVDWIKRIIPIIERANLWQYGGDLIKANTGIVMHPLETSTEQAAARSGYAAKLEDPP